MNEVDFGTIEVLSDDGEVMVDLEWIGEGNCGEYNPEDPEDQPLIRYSLYRKFHMNQDPDEIANVCDVDVYEEGEWMAVEDGSYCTQLVATAPKEQLEAAAKFILEQVEDELRDFQREKRLYERLSWIKLEDGEPVV